MDVYFARLEVKNAAGLQTSSVSTPIILDSISPRPGTVSDGINFTEDKVYQSSTTQMEGNEHLI